MPTISPGKLLILGATGGTGRELVAQALGQGHEVTALARRPDQLPPSAGLRVVAGSLPENREALAAAMRGQDAVISALGTGASLKSSGLMRRSLPAIRQAMEAAGVRRLIVTSAYGVGPTRRDVPLLPRLMIGLLLRDIYADKAAGEEDLRRSALDWTLVYPVTLTKGPRTGRYRVGERLALRGLPRISRADLADFLLRQVDDGTYVRKGVLISS
jgi:putative NADH-flavin reductase